MPAPTPTRGPTIGARALSITAGIVGAVPALKLLLDYGADPTPWRATDPSPLREAARVGDADMFRLLLPYVDGLKSPRCRPAEFLRTWCFACAEIAGVGAGGPLARAAANVGDRSRRRRATIRADRPGRRRSARRRRTPAGIRAAVERSLPLLQDVGVAFIRQSGCVSCHHNSVVSMAVEAARAHGYTVNEATADAQATRDRHLSRVVARARRAEHPDRRRGRHDGLPAVRPRRGSLSAGCRDRCAGALPETSSGGGRTLAAQHHPPADRVERDRGDRGLDAGASGVCAAVAARRVRDGGRSRARLADHRPRRRHRGARVPSAGAAVGERIERRHRRGGARSPGASERRWRVGADARRWGAMPMPAAKRWSPCAKAAPSRSPIAPTARDSSSCCARRSTTDRGSSRRGRCRFRRTSRAGFPTA